MKKTILFILIITSVVCLFAIDNNRFQGLNDSAYNPTSLLNHEDLNYSLFNNPANLAKSRIKFNIPSVTLDVRHLTPIIADNKKILPDTNITKFIIDSVQNGFNTGDLVLVAKRVFELLPGGTSNIAIADFETGFQIKHFAVGLNVQANMGISSGEYNPQLTNFSVIPYLNASLSLGYGRAYEAEKVYLAGGISTHINGKVFAEKIGASKALEIVGKEVSVQSLMDSISVDAGCSFSTDLAVSVRFFNKRFGVDFSLNNLFGNYTMKHFDNVTSMKDFIMNDPSYSDNNIEPYSFGTSTTESIYLVADLSPKSWDGILSIHTKFGLKNLDGGKINIKNNLDMSASVNYADMIECSIASTSGYRLYGLALNLHIYRLEMVYGWHEEGKILGEKPVDSLSFKFTFGYED